MTSAWAGRRVLVTGHTGFKGAWMCAVLERLGAQITGLALPPEPGDNNLFSMLAPSMGTVSRLADIRDGAAVKAIVTDARPEMVIHLAAQSLVRKSYDQPFETFDVNVRGTLTLLQALVDSGQSAPVLVITSDKVYRNDNQGRSFLESDALGGEDPYSASKAACEIAARAFADTTGLKVATARAGNVVGGGDFARDRLLTDAWQAYVTRTPLTLRHPDATRPWQHVLDVVFAYLRHAAQLLNELAGAPAAVNIGPEADPLTVSDALVAFYSQLTWSPPHQVQSDAQRPEKTRLDLDPGLAWRALGWRNRLSQTEALHWAAQWYSAWDSGQSPVDITTGQIEAYLNHHGT
ncbi:CDP-glucose 4,6-dehydratase [Asticcacaulis sp. AC402]|uniref:CDP-glucose 4,6-dehydratase n=1 Tax=Asticcacaulis sp. AC402 TaxID=1282361 RepID=UPI00068B43F8|nr:CDP-glucose 4,6-dehydratase [Asticcacaulis sp. AC402]